MGGQGTRHYSQRRPPTSFRGWIARGETAQCGASNFERIDTDSNEISLSAALTRLQIATRMHELLLAEIGCGIEVERLLTRDRYARDVLLVCDACAGTELPQLSAQFRRLTPVKPASAPTAPVPPQGHTAQTNEWARDSSGFGLSRPLEWRSSATPAGTEDPPGRPSRQTWR